ncbi:MAG: NDP-sugar synthase [Candidatus Jorgensenbacteria bacterium]
MQKKDPKVKQAVILAGGLGTRLWPLTRETPKPMVRVVGKPFLHHLIDLLKKEGIEEVVLLLGYLPEKVVSYFKDGSRVGLKIKYHITDPSFQNGTRVKKAEPLFDETFLLLYGDIYWPLNLNKHIEFYKTKNVPVMMTVYNNKDGKGEFGYQNCIKTLGDYVTYYGPLSDNPEFQGLDLGFFIVNREVMKIAPRGDFEWQTDFLRPLIAKKQLAAYRTDKHYCTITNQQLLKSAEEFLMHHPSK